MALVRLNLKTNTVAEREQALLLTLKEHNYHAIRTGQSLVILLEDDVYWQSSAKLFQLALKFTDVSSLPEVVKRDLTAETFVHENSLLDIKDNPQTRKSFHS